MAWTDGVKAGEKAPAGLSTESLPQLVAEIPWGHNVWLMEKVKIRSSASGIPWDRPMLAVGAFVAKRI